MRRKKDYLADVIKEGGLADQLTEVANSIAVSTKLLAYEYDHSPSEDTTVLDFQNVIGLPMMVLESHIPKLQEIASELRAVKQFSEVPNGKSDS